jgi:hypothetical protein
VIKSTGGSENVRIVLGDLDTRGTIGIVKPGSLVGKPLPNLKDLNIPGEQTDTNARPVLICFFDMQQRPSRRCILQLAQQVDGLQSQGIRVLAVQSTKLDNNLLKAWITENQISFPVGTLRSSEEEIRFAWGVKSLPWMILTNDKHVVRAEGFGMDELDTKLKK